jgi:hypothetical protein
LVALRFWVLSLSLDLFVSRFVKGLGFGSCKGGVLIGFYKGSESGRGGFMDKALSLSLSLSLPLCSVWCPALDIEVGYMIISSCGGEGQAKANKPQLLSHQSLHK